MSTLNAFQEQFGIPSAGARDKVRPYMIDWIQQFIRQSPFMVLSTSSADGRCDASPKGGRPGFVKVLDDRHLLIPDVAGNRLFQSYDNVSHNPSAGLLFMIPGEDCTARVNGTVEVVDKERLAAMNVEMEIFNPDEHAKIWQGLLLTVDEAYAHCPRAFKFSKLWDTQTIEHNRANPMKLP